MNVPKIDSWETFAKQSRYGDRLYPRLARSILNDEEIKALGAKARTQPAAAHTLFAAVHFLLLRGARHELRELYPTLNPAVDKNADPFPAFRDFCHVYRSELEQLVSQHITNTNEVGRSSILNAGFRALAREAGAPLQLVELGPSAGLNLIWDKYGVRYTKNDEIAAFLQPESPIVIDCELRGEKPPPFGSAPPVDKRIGIELNPVDLKDADDRDWLRALVWADEPARLKRLERAIEEARRTKFDIRTGDVLQLLPDVLRELPDGVACAYHTNTIYQFPQKAQEQLEQIFIDVGKKRPLWRLSVEGYPNDFYLQLVSYDKGRRQERFLGGAHWHGTWLAWAAAP